jgi:predicted acyltransferase
LTAADKKYVDSIPTDIITSKVNQVNPTANDVTLVHSVSRKQDGVHAPAGNLSITINAATSTLAGVMAAKDKEELDRINSANFEVDEITATESVIQIATSKTVVEDGSVEQDTLTIPTSTADKAGVQSAADKKLFDSIPEVHFTESGNIIPAADKVTISHSISRVTDGIYQPAGNLRKDIPAATQELAGVMTAADKVKLDVTLPN